MSLGGLAENVTYARERIKRGILTGLYDLSIDGYAAQTFIGGYMKGTIGHRDRKNPHMHEVYKEQNRKRNLARGKQFWDGKKWIRISAD
jgi:hypothetical protein